MLNEGNHSGSGTVINYGSGSGSDFLTSYGSGSGSGSSSQKVTVPAVPVPVPVPKHCLEVCRVLAQIRIYVLPLHYRDCLYFYKFCGSGTFKA